MPAVVAKMQEKTGSAAKVPARKTRANGAAVTQKDAGRRPAYDDAAAQIAALHQSRAIIEFALDGTIITANQNFLDLLGYSLAEIQGRPHSMFVEPAYRDSEDYRRFWTALTHGE